MVTNQFVLDDSHRVSMRELDFLPREIGSRLDERLLWSLRVGDRLDYFLVYKGIIDGHEGLASLTTAPRDIGVIVDCDRNIWALRSSPTGATSLSLSASWVDAAGVSHVALEGTATLASTRGASELLWALATQVYRTRDGEEMIWVKSPTLARNTMKKKASVSGSVQQTPGGKPTVVIKGEISWEW